MRLIGVVPVLLLSVVVHAAPARKAVPTREAAPVPRAVHMPVRVTAGQSNQLLGELHPDGRRLFFVSDREATTQIMVQDVAQGGAKLLWDADADVTSPRLSPDGRNLLYVSFERDANGDLCIMPLSKEAQDSEGGGRRCLTGSDGAENQPFWFPDGKSVGAVARTDVHADMQLRRWSAGGGGKGAVVLDRNLTAPAVSPDGVWLAYVPVTRSSDAVGVHFAQDAEKVVELARIDDPGQARTLRFEPDLPGVSGYPAFSQDGRWLYFAQYLNDTNFDGATNGSDHAVVFRTPFDSKANPPVRPGKEQQLTSARWNCQYPAPAKALLVMTCSRHGSLDIYTLPLQGSVPAAWDPARVRGEVEASRDPLERLLLLGRLASMKVTPHVRRQTLREMATLHLELREYASARFYAERAEAPGWSQAMVQLVQHRKDERLLNRGQLSRRFLDVQLGRIKALELAADPGDASVTALTKLARAEVLDVIGREAEAVALLREIELAAVTDPLVLRLLAGRPLEVYGQLGLREQRLQMLAALAVHPALDDHGRMAMSDRLIGALTVGADKAVRRERLTTWRTGADPDGELALLLDVHLALLDLPAANSDPIRKALFAIFKRARALPRRRGVVMAILSAAASHDDANLLYQFANSYVAVVRQDDPERKHGEALWRDVVLEQAYLQRAEGNVGDARGNFFTVTLQTPSLEAHAGFIEARRLEGKSEAEIRQEYDKRYDKGADRRTAVYRYVRSYLTYRDKPRNALIDVMSAARQQPQSPAAHQLWGLILHRHFVATGQRQAATQAYEHYLLALDLARELPRSAAAIEHMAGLLQASAGNHRLALTHYDRRLRWPFLDPGTELSLRSARSRSLFMADMDAEASVEAGRALAIAQQSTELQKLLPLVRDRTALYRYAAGDAAGAQELYSQAPPGFPSDVMLAAAALAAGAPDPEAVRAARVTLQGIKSLPRQDRYNAGFEDYELLLDGLKGESLQAAGDSASADAPAARREAALAARHDEAPGSRLALDLAAVAFQRARYALTAGDRPAAVRHAERGLSRSDEHDELTGSPWNPVGLRLVLLLAELRLAHGAPASALSGGDPELATRVGRAYKALCERPSPRRAAERFVLGLYLTMLGAKP